MEYEERLWRPQGAVAALGALAHDTRLAVYRLLVQRGPDGLSAGLIAQAVALPPSSLDLSSAAIDAMPG